MGVDGRWQEEGGDGGGENHIVIMSVIAARGGPWEGGGGGWGRYCGGCWGEGALHLTTERLEKVKATRGEIGERGR